MFRIQMIESETNKKRFFNTELPIGFIDGELHITTVTRKQIIIPNYNPILINEIVLIGCSWFNVSELHKVIFATKGDRKTFTRGIGSIKDINGIRYQIERIENKHNNSVSYHIENFEL